MSARKYLLCCQRDHFHYCASFFSREDAASLTKEAIDFLQFKLVLRFFKITILFCKVKILIGSPYWVVWHWKPFYKYSLLRLKKKNPSHGGPCQHGLLFLVPSSKDSSPTLASKVDQLEGMLKMLREDLKKVNTYSQSKLPSLCKLPLNLESPF